MSNTKNRMTMQEFLAWEKTVELTACEFEQTTGLSLGPETVTVKVKRVWPLKPTQKIIPNPERPERVRIVFHRGSDGVTHETSREGLGKEGWRVCYPPHQSTTEACRTLGVPHKHDLPDEVVLTPPVPTWADIGRGSYADGEGGGQVLPRFRWEVVEELQKLLELDAVKAEKGSATVVVGDSEGVCVYCGHITYVGGCPVCGAPS